MSKKWVRQEKIITFGANHGPGQYLAAKVSISGRLWQKYCSHKKLKLVDPEGIYILLKTDNAVLYYQVELGLRILDAGKFESLVLKSGRPENPKKHLEEVFVRHSKCKFKLPDSDKELRQMALQFYEELYSVVVHETVDSKIKLKLVIGNELLNKLIDSDSVTDIGRAVTVCLELIESIKHSQKSYKFELKEKLQYQLKRAKIRLHFETIIIPGSKKAREFERRGKFSEAENSYQEIVPWLEENEKFFEKGTFEKYKTKLRRVRLVIILSELYDWGKEKEQQSESACALMAYQGVEILLQKNKGLISKGLVPKRIVSVAEDIRRIKDSRVRNRKPVKTRMPLDIYKALQHPEFVDKVTDRIFDYPGLIEFDFSNRDEVVKLIKEKIVTAEQFIVAQHKIVDTIADWNVSPYKKSFFQRLFTCNWKRKVDIERFEAQLETVTLKCN